MKLGDNLELDEERKQILSAIEEKRKKKLEEKKEDELKAVFNFFVNLFINNDRLKFSQFSMVLQLMIIKEEAIFCLLWT